jgi:hypothetical protein
LRPFAETGCAWGLRHSGRSLALAIGAGLAFGLWMVAADRWVFAAIVPSSQQALFTGPEYVTIAWLVLRDEVLLRGLVLPLLLWAGLSRHHLGPPVAILLTALVAWPLLNFGYAGSLTWSALVLSRELTLHVAAGCLWGWLCWRHGWLAGLTGHIAAYGALLPLS